MQNLYPKKLPLSNRSRGPVGDAGGKLGRRRASWDAAGLAAGQLLSRKLGKGRESQGKGLHVAAPPCYNSDDKRGRNSAVECQLPKLNVEGSNPFARSKCKGRS
jgi:hypothetical protein